MSKQQCESVLPIRHMRRIEAAFPGTDYKALFAHFEKHGANIAPDIERACETGIVPEYLADALKPKLREP